MCCIFICSAIGLFTPAALNYLQTHWVMHVSMTVMSLGNGNFSALSQSCNHCHVCSLLTKVSLCSEWLYVLSNYIYVSYTYTVYTHIYTYIYVYCAKNNWKPHQPKPQKDSLLTNLTFLYVNIPLFIFFSRCIGLEHNSSISFFKIYF